MTDQDLFISKVSAALGRPAPTARRRKTSFYSRGNVDTAAGVRQTPSRTAADRRALLNRLVERGKPLNLNVIPTHDTASAAAAITDMVARKNPEWEGPKTVAAWRHPLIGALNLAPLLAERQIDYFTAAPTSGPAATSERTAIRRRMETAFVGITSADYCLADTGTLVLISRADCARAVSLLPTIHVAVIELEQIIADLTELYTQLISVRRNGRHRLGNCLTMITGPSKTADIELTMVHGAHGPRELHLYVIAPRTWE